LGLPSRVAEDVWSVAVGVKEDLIVRHSSRWSQFLLILGLATLLAFAGARAQNVSFSTPYHVSNNSDISSAPQLGVDASRNTYVIWEDDTAGNILFSRSTDGGTTFSAPQNISSNPQNLSPSMWPYNPRLAVEPNGTINVLWLGIPSDSTSWTYDVFFARSTDGGANFSSPLNLSNDASDNAEPQIAVDAIGNIHVVWENDSDTLGVLYSKSSDSGASFSTPATLASGSSLAPQLATAGDNVYVAWEDVSNSNISFSRSTDGGANFLAAKSLTPNRSNPLGVMFAVDASGYLNATWIDNTSGTYELIFSRSTDLGATFSDPLQVSNNPGDAGDQQMTTDAAGNIYLAWRENSPADIYFARSADGGVTFSDSVNLSNNSGISSTPWLNLDAAGNINVGWEDNSRPNNTTGTSQILFTQSVDNGTTFSPTQKLSDDVDSATGVQIVSDKDANINVVWSDSVSGTSQILFSRHVGNANHPPKADAGPDQPGPGQPPIHATSPTTAVTLDGSGSSDPDGDTLTYVWKEGGLEIANGKVAPANLPVGSHTITLTVTDSGDLSASDDVQIMITDEAPVADAGADKTLTATGAVTPVTLNGSATDPDDAVDALTFVWTEGATQVGTGATGPVYLTVGSHTLTLTVSDPAGLSSSPALTNVTITPKPNQAPLANPGPDQTLTAAGTTTLVTLDGSASIDPDGDVLTYAWTEGTTPVGNSAVVHLNLTPGQHTFTLTVKDPGGLSSSAVTHVTITKANQPPVAKAGPNQNITCAPKTGALVTLDGSLSSDPDGDTLSFLWTDESNHIVGTSAVIKVTVPEGTHVFTLTVADPGGLSSTTTTQVTVVCSKPTLSVSVSPSVLWPPNHKMVQITATVSVSDPCDSNPMVQLMSITRSDGNTGNNVQALDGGPVPFGTDVRSFLVRSENSDTGGDLLYIVTYSAQDSLGNSTLTSAQVRVAKDSTSAGGLNPGNKKGK
jgi:hypothetical protein